MIGGCHELESPRPLWLALCLLAYYCCPRRPQVYGEMVERQVDPNTHTYDLLIATCAQARGRGGHDDALAMYQVERGSRAGTKGRGG